MADTGTLGPTIEESGIIGAPLPSDVLVLLVVFEVVVLDGFG